MSLFRYVRNVFRQPGTGFIATVALLVFVCAGALWQASHSVRGRGSVAQAAGVPPEASGETPGEIMRSDPSESGGIVSRARLKSSGLVYEEALGSPLDDSVKQIDFAFVQALLRSNLSLDNVVIETSELRHAKNEPYIFQRLHVPMAGDPVPFLASLYDSLRTWAEDAELVQGKSITTEIGRGALWTIRLGDTTTHELVLFSMPAHEMPEKSDTRKSTSRHEPGDSARLVIVIDDIGEDMRVVRQLLGLPFPVTLSIWPHSSYMEKAARAGHEAGLEILVHQPAEPMRYPEMNPGPRALFLSLSDGEIEKRVWESAMRVPYAIGMNNHMGSRFTRDVRAAAAMARPLKELGFFVLDSVTHPASVLYAEAKRMGVPALKRDVFLDAVQTKENVLNQLRKAEKIALAAGTAIAIGHPLPETLAGLAEWGRTRNVQVECVRLADLLVTQGDAP